MILYSPIGNNRYEAQKKYTEVQMQKVELALDYYRLDFGVYPSTKEGLLSLIIPKDKETSRKWRKDGYLDGNIIPKDSWGNNFIYIYPGIHGKFDIISYGADGVKGGRGQDKDIGNWEIKY